MTYRLSPRGEGLAVTLVEPDLDRADLALEGPDRARAPWCAIRFERDGAGAPTGFVLDSGRAKGIASTS